MLYLLAMNAFTLRGDIRHKANNKVLHFIFRNVLLRATSNYIKNRACRFSLKIKIVLFPRIRKVRNMRSSIVMLGNNISTYTPTCAYVTETLCL